MRKVVATLAASLAAIGLSWIPAGVLRAATSGAVEVVAAADNLRGMACPTPTSCLAVGNNPSGSLGVVVPFSNGVPGVAQVVPGVYRLEAIACTGSSTCLAVGSSTGPSATAVVVPVVTGVAGGAQPVVGADLGLYGIACPTPTLCVAVGANGASQGVVVAITNGTPGTAQIVAGAGELAGVDCDTATTCQAVGTDLAGDEGVIVPIDDATAGPAVDVPETAGLIGIACPAVSQCEAAGVNASTQGVVTSVVGGIPAWPQVVPGAAYLLDVACATPFLCETAGFSASATAVADSLSDGVPAPVQAVPGAAALLGVICPDSSVCDVAGVNSSSQGVIGTVNPVFTLPYPALLTYPLQGQTADTTQPFRISDVPGAQGYLLVVGSTYHGTDLFNSGFLSPTTSSITMPALPPGKTLYATLFTESNNSWVYLTSTFTAAPGLATFTNPLNGATLANRQPTFKWSTIAASQGTILVVGTTPYGTDLLDTGVLSPQQSSYQAPVLPTGKTLYANLLTKVDGAWTRYQHIQFTLS